MAAVGNVAMSAAEATVAVMMRVFMIPPSWGISFFVLVCKPSVWHR